MEHLGSIFWLGALMRYLSNPRDFLEGDLLTKLVAEKNRVFCLCMDV